MRGEALYQKSAPDRLLRLRDVMGMVGLGRSALFDRVRNGQFPEPLRLSKRAVAWRESEVVAWIDSLPRRGRCVSQDAPEGRR